MFKDWTIFRQLQTHMTGYYRPLTNFKSIMQSFWLAGKNPEELEK